MNIAVQGALRRAPSDKSEVLDALIIGAGVAGMYQLHQLRKQGLKVQAVDAATDVGGTWYWNRYPGAKFDSESYIYQYLFDETLYKDWTWSERFPAQPEIERWMHYIADRLELRPDILFGTTVTSAEYDEERGRWTVHTDRGDTFHAVPDRLLRHALGTAGKPFPGPVHFPGPDLPHGAVAARAA